MERTINKITISYLFLIIFVGAFFFNPNTGIRAEVQLPELLLEYPDYYPISRSKTVTLRGQVNTETGEYENYKIKMAVDSELEATNININIDGTWSYTHTFEEGSHEISFELFDNLSETTLDSENLFYNIDPAYTDNTNPFIIDIKIVPITIRSQKPFIYSEDMTQVTLNPEIIVTIKENGPLNVGQFLLLNEKESGSSISLISTPQARKKPNGNWEITFLPEQTLKNTTTYFLYIKPVVSDYSGRFISSKFLKFTTKSSMEDGHGNSENTQSCANCHNTHTAGNKGLLGGNYAKNLSSNYCMACHDGTLGIGAPIIKEFSSHKHSQVAGDNNNSCTNCHDPHQSNLDNPNLLKDHFVFNHESVEEKYPNTELPGTVDSDDLLCESCHEENLDVVKVTSHYRVLSYNKSNLVQGDAINDFALCFQCHNNTSTDIKKFYTNPEIVGTSGHSFLPLDRDTSQSGSNIQMPCADCHETHGSINIKSLKKKLGHEIREDDYVTNSGWSEDNERRFCLKCHNGTTVMYGKSVKFSEKNSQGSAIVGHETTNTQACSDCHGDGSSDFFTRSKSAAHAPIKGEASPKQFTPLQLPTPPVE
jgi:predicted CXXCH cytochrome family protein